MLARIVSYGLIAGLVAGLPMIALIMAMDGHPPTSWGMVVGYLTMLVAFSTIFVAIKRRRDRELGGAIPFWPAFGLGLGISVVAGLCYVIAWEASQAIDGGDFAAEFARAMIAQERARGTSGAGLARYIAEMDQFRVNYANPLFRLPMTFAEIFPVGVLVSLVSAGLLANRRFLPARRD